MPNINPSDVIEMRLAVQLDDQLSINVVHFSCVGATGASVTGVDVASYFSSLVPAVMKPCITSAAQYIGLSIQKIIPAPAFVPDYNYTNAGAGTSGANPLPTQVSGVAKKETALAGRAFRGRFYMPFPATSDNDTDHTPTAGYISNFATFCNGLFNAQFVNTGPGSVSLLPVILHRESKTVTAHLGTTVRDKWGTQRRRGGFGRPNAGFP